MAKKKPSAGATTVATKPPMAGGESAKGRDKPPKGAAAEKSHRQSWFSPEARREIVESVVVAFVLAFLFRTFEAEAFVIPTGSMAPTLMGRHRDVTCAKCGYPYQINASNEVDPRTNRLTGHQVVAGTCPVCRFTMDVGPGNPQRKPYPSFKGDRILVAKFPYQFGQPDRWDVAVFKYPGGAKTNYIKRIVGLPNETLYIHHGDLWVKPDGQEEVTIARKPHDKVVAMMQPVYDNDYVLPGLIDKGLPPRWSPVLAVGRVGGGWQAASDLKSFRTDGTARGEAWLHYRHCPPTYAQWRTLQIGSELSPASVPRQLITDFTSYNTEQTAAAGSRRRGSEHASELLGMGEPPGVEQIGLHWVGDLVLECSVSAEQASGQLLLTLVEGGVPFRCEIDLGTGRAELSIDGLEGFQPSAATCLRGPGKHDLRFANVDDQLLLWVDGRPVKFDAPTTYGPLSNARPQRDDLQPARIGSRGASLEVSHLRLFRDIYYIAERRNVRPMTDYEIAADEFHRYFSGDGEEALVNFFADSEAWDVFLHRRRVEFHLAADQFLALGDNSAESKDSRLWESDGPLSYAPPQFYVTRDLLIGKALFIYWPHSWDKVPGTDGWPLAPDGVWFPFFPNFARMGAVR